MSKSRVVRYRTRSEAADENARPAENVLAAEKPDGVRHAVFRLAEGRERDGGGRT